MEPTYLTFYAFPGLDARIGLALVDDQLAVTFLAEGCARYGKAGAYTYKRRNPDRRKAFARMFLPENTWPKLQPHMARGGKAANGCRPMGGKSDRNATLLKAFRKGGNFRFDCWAPIFASVWETAVWNKFMDTDPTLGEIIKARRAKSDAFYRPTLDEIATVLGLEPTKNRPVKARLLPRAMPSALEG